LLLTSFVKRSGVDLPMIQWLIQNDSATEAGQRPRSLSPGERAAGNPARQIPLQFRCSAV
jgi:hypothetical protein